MTPKLPAPTHILTTRALVKLVDTLKDEPLLGFDTESNSLHAYRERVCLVQVSSRKQDYIIDPLALDDMSPLGALLENPHIKKVFHASEYDLMCLRRDFGFTVQNLFDTMLAARVCGIRQIGLSNLLSMYIGIEIDKSHQRDNWGERPLRPDSLRYAQMDTHYLPDLHDILYTELQKNGHLEEARELFSEYLADTRSHERREFDPEGFWKIGIPNQLTPSQMAVLREVYLMREHIAECEDKPSYKVINTQGLIDMARYAPTTVAQLGRVSEISSTIRNRYAEELLGAVKHAHKVQLPDPPRHRPPPPETSDLYMTLHTWRKERAIQRGVESDVILSKQVLWALAYQMPQTRESINAIRGFGEWRRAQYADELLEIIRNHCAKITPPEGVLLNGATSNPENLTSSNGSSDA